tara:strand:+ start:58 stop:375 length:318 start_codon:yes stop_codon:yes gene_type:complete
MTFTLYHNKNCSKSRACLEILNKHKIDFQVREYIKHPLTLQEVGDIIENLSGNKNDLLRKSEKDIDSKDLANFIFDNQKKLQRPIFFNGKKYIICRPPEKVLDCI